MRVAMIGTGYVGLVSGACFADFGHHVICVDKDAAKIAALQRGEMPIYEPGLGALVAANVKAGRLSFATDLTGPVAEAGAVFIAVGTPSRRGDGHADLSYVYAAAKEIAAALDGFTVVVTKSTVPVGTGDEVERIIREARPDADVAVVSNPEFLREGAAIRDFKHARPHRRRHRRRPRVEGDGRAVPPALSQPFADHHYRPPHRRADQIRGQRFPRHQDHLHQRDRGPVRARRCRRAGGCARHRARQPDRRQIPTRRSGLWRLVLSQGHAGADQDRAGLRGAASHRRDGRLGQRNPQARHGAQGGGRARREPARQDRGACWASPSSRTPTTCATRHRSR